LDHDVEVREDSGLLAGVEAIVHGLFDRRQQRLSLVVEAQQVAVLGEKLGDGDFSLLLGHRLGRRPAPQLFGRGRWDDRMRPGFVRLHCGLYRKFLFLLWLRHAIVIKLEAQLVGGISWAHEILFHENVGPMQGLP
jgi:hypothetical protein